MWMWTVDVDGDVDVDGHVDFGFIHSCIQVDGLWTGPCAQPEGYQEELGQSIVI